jgi:hypothetical protein
MHGRPELEMVTAVQRCPHCGAANPPNLADCYACARSLADRPPRWRFEMVRTCGFCGTANLRERASCYVCGDRLAEPEDAVDLPGETPTEPARPREASLLGSNPGAWRSTESALRRAWNAHVPEPAPPPPRRSLLARALLLLPAAGESEEEEGSL